MTGTYYSLAIFIVVLFSTGLRAEVTVASVKSGSYPVVIGAERHIVQGRVSSFAEPGTLIPYDIIEEFHEDSDMRKHLRVEIRESSYTRPHVYHPDPSNPQFEHPTIKFINNTLPPGMEFVVIKTNAFFVNEDRYIVVNDFGSINENIRIHFDVVLKDTLSQVHYVSNHLPFVVEVEFPHKEHNANSALFAGVLILTIVAISLIIPFVVRAKRRSKAGKPICGCGSAEDGSDDGSTGSGPEKNRKISVGGKDNLAMMLDNGGLMQHRRSIDPHTTIQNAMLRSTSNIHFQPHWMDPHYRDVYDRPEYADPHLAPPTNGQLGNNNGYVNPAFMRGVSSSRSSLDSKYEYPLNFNPQLLPQPMKNGGHLHNSTSRINGKVSTNQIKQKKDQPSNGSLASLNSRKTSLPPKISVTDSDFGEEALVGATGGDNSVFAEPPNYNTVTASEKL